MLGQLQHHAPTSGGGTGAVGWLWQWLFGFAALPVLGLGALLLERREAWRGQPAPA